MKPFVSVVIPMRNEAGWIKRCLQTVRSQDYPADRFEILVADGHSDDGSAELLRSLAEEDPRLKVLDNPACIVPSGLNLAIRHSGGEIIARVDAHTTLETDYISRGVELLASTGAQNVGGPMVAVGGGEVGDAVAAAMGSRFGIGAEFHFARGEQEADTVYMGMWPRSVFEDVGLFDEDLVRNQDDELNYRIRKSGGRILLSSRMRSKYQNRQSWSGLVRQFFQYGLWKVRVLQKHPRQMSLRHFIPPAYDLGLVLALALAPWSPLAATVALVAVAVYAVVIASVVTFKGKGLAGRVRLFAAFAVIHHAWAMGFLVGLVRFAGRWGHGGKAPGLDRT